MSICRWYCVEEIAQLSRYTYELSWLYLALMISDPRRWPLPAQCTEHNRAFVSWLQLVITYVSFFCLLIGGRFVAP